MRTEDEECVRVPYEPTHVLSGGDSFDDEIKSFKLFERDAEALRMATTAIKLKGASHTMLACA